MDSAAKNLACRAVLTLAVFLLPAAEATGEQGSQRRDALFEFELRDHTPEHWLEEFFYTDEGRPPGWAELEPEPAPAPEPTPEPAPLAASPYPALPPKPVPAPLTAAPGPTPGNTLLPENATYYRAPTDLILPDERLTDGAFRERLSHYLSSFGGTPEQILNDFKFQQVGDFWDGINAERAYARGLSGRGVRIGIVDTGVDILHPEFAGRVQRRGTFMVRKIPHIHRARNLAEVFSGCREEGAGCRVFEIDAGGDRALIEHYAHRIIEAERHFPDEYNTWFIRDLSRDADGWHAIPGLYKEEADPAQFQHPAHGTWVASLAAGWRYGVAPGATIRPLLLEEFRSIHFDGDAFLTGDDASKAQAYRDFLSHSDIINYSVGSFYYDWQISDETWLREGFPAYWAAFTQQDAQEKTIIVWAADNYSLGHPSPAASLPVREPAVRGHWLAVAAADYGLFVGSSNRCGPLPDDWNPQAHGRHYCLTAPAPVRSTEPNFNPETDPRDAVASFHRQRGGTSSTAPLVAGGIALVMERFRGQLSNREVALRVVNTANNAGIYADAAIYGAGMLDLDAATAPVGEVSTGTASLQAGLHRTRLATPPAWGRVGRHLAGREVAGFDDWNAPFWQPAASLFATTPAPQAILPVPGWDEGFEQRALLSHLRWFGAGREDGLRMTLWGDGFHAAGFRGDFPGNGFAAETDYHAFGFSGELREQLRLGVIVETQTNQGARPAGAFGAAANSKLVWVAREHAWPLSFASGVALRLDYLVAAGQPDYARGAMFNATGSLYSAASLALEHRGAATRTRLSIGQPLRAESGRGTLRYAVGRDRAGNWRYEEARFALRPETREVRFQLRHDRPLFKGQLAVELSYAHNADHVPGQHRTQAGLGYRRAW